MSDDSTTSGSADEPSAREQSDKPKGFIGRIVGSIGGPGIMGNVPIVAVGAACGLVGGYLLGSLDAGTYSATTVVNGNVVGTSSPPELVSSDIVGTYTSTELSFFGFQTKAMQKAIAEQTGQANPTAPVAVVDKGTALINITASGPTAAASAQASMIAADMYINDWRARSIASINQQKAATNAALAAIRPNDPGEAGLEGQLAAQEYDLKATEAAVRLIRPATPEAAVYTSSGTTIALLGGLLGTMAGLGVLLLFRRRRSQQGA